MFLKLPTLGSLTRAAMLPAIRAARFLASPERSRNPRCNTGTIKARLAASTWGICFRLQDSRLSLGLNIGIRHHNVHPTIWDL